MKTRIVFIFLGAGIAAYGIHGLIGATSTHALTSAVKWFIGGALIHDFVVAPLVIVIGVLLTRFIPPFPRPFVQAGLFVTAALTLVALPFLSGRGYRATNPSALPLNYGRGYAIAVGVVWVLTGLVGLAAFARSRYRAKGARRR